MNWYNSIITKISIIFAMAIAGIGAILFLFHTQIKQIEITNMQRYSRVVLNSAYNNKTKTINFEALKLAGYELITDETLKNDILQNDALTLGPRHMMGNGRNSNRLRFKIVEYRGDFFVLIQRNYILKAPHEKSILPKILLPITAILLIILLYIATVKSILPIYSLRQKVKEFAEGNYDIDCKSDKKDEIAILSNEFDNSVKKIKKLRDSRQLFLRNIMHELKTPITKGKLSCEMIEESPYINTLKNVFKRQESLLEEFARIEKLSANELALKKENYSLEDIVDFSLDILNHDKKYVTCKLSPMNLNVDFELFGTAIKNLLDNGINYSDDLHVNIESFERKIFISNIGKELEFPLERYSEPYFLEGKKQKSSRGLGFGLFITINLIKLHDMKILYNREGNKNTFTIEV